MSSAEIYIDKLKVTDFGPFYGAHEFDFSSVGDKRAILIGGKNGAGKTHLLRALYLATVGESGAGDLKKVEAGSEATKFDIKESLNRRARSEGKSTSNFEISLSLRDSTGFVGRQLTLIRQIRHRPNSPPIFTAKAYLPDDGVYVDDEQRVQKLRDTFLPRHLARFFFFDAERSQSLQLNDREIIEGISRVLGLYSYTELEGDLQNLIRSKIPQRYGSGSESERELNDLVYKIKKEEADIESYYLDIKEIKREINNTEEELIDIEDQLQTIGVVDPEEIVKLNEQRDAINDVKRDLENQLRSAWESALPVSLLGDLRMKLFSALEKEERRRDWENRKSSVEPKIPKIKNEVFSEPPPEHSLSTASEEYYKEKLEEALKGLFDPPEEGLAGSIYIVPERNELSIRVRNQLLDKPSEIIGLADRTDELDKKTAELREMNQRLKQLNQDPVAQKRGDELRERRGELNHKKNLLERNVRELEIKIQSLKDNLQENKRKASNLSEKVQKVRQGRDLNSLALRYSEAVSEIKERAAIQLREKISHIVGDLWLEVTDRGFEYRALEFDKNWNCFLVKPDQSQIEWSSANTSAGQRQVRILAFTEALRRLARFSPPLVVDTPLGRLDQEVKKEVLNRLYLTGHQSIILTTNSEVPATGQLIETITPKLARVYTLVPEGDEDSQSYHVKVEQNYFKYVL